MNIRLNRKKQSKAVNKIGRTAFSLVALHINHWFRPNVEIAAGAVTGYGEEIIKNAFCVDFGIVETVAHLTAAKAEALCRQRGP